MKKRTLRAVDMVRRIRDAHYEQLRDKTPDEWIVFYRAKVQSLQAQLAAQRHEQPMDGTKSP